LGENEFYVTMYSFCYSAFVHLLMYDGLALGHIFTR